MIKFPKYILSRGQSRLSSEDSTTLTTAGTYYLISGTFVDGDIKDFTLTTAGKLTYIGADSVTFLLNGVSDLSVDKACVLTYGLHLNGTLITAAQTPHTFVAASKKENIAITSLITLNKSDYLEVFAKSDQAITVLTASSLITTYVATQH